MKNNKTRNKEKTETQSYFYNEFRQKFYGNSENKGGQYLFENRSFGEPLAKEAVKKIKEKLEFY